MIVLALAPVPAGAQGISHQAASSFSAIRFSAVSRGPSSGTAGWATNSLEWVAGESEVIVRGEIVSADAQAIIVTVTETLKHAGDPIARGRLTLQTDAAYLPPPICRDALLFLTRTPKGLRLRDETGYIVLNGTQAVESMDLRTLLKPGEILDATRRALAEPTSRQRVDIRRISGPGAGSYLTVPRTPRLEQLARRWATDSDSLTRLLGVRVLAEFRNEQNIELLHTLLDDRGVTSVHGGFGKWRRGFFGVRFAAHMQLREWGVQLPEPNTAGSMLVYRPITLSRAWLLLLPAVLAVWFLLPWGFSLRKTGGRQRAFSWAGTLRNGATVLSLLLAIASCLLWWRSYTVVDEAMFRMNRSHHQFASYRGGLQYLAAGNWADPTGPACGSFVLQQTQDEWSVAALSPKATKTCAGFLRATGGTIGPEGLSHSYSLFRAPYWCLLLLLLILPAMSVLRLGRRRRRRGRGQCTGCGYDLRASLPSGLCPECGLAIGG